MSEALINAHDLLLTRVSLEHIGAIPHFLSNRVSVLRAEMLDNIEVAPSMRSDASKASELTRTIEINTVAS